MHVANKSLSIVVSQYGLPECITSSPDSRFCGHLWDKLMSFLDMTLTLSMASHPYTDGIAEVTNYIME